MESTVCVFVLQINRSLNQSFWNAIISQQNFAVAVSTQASRSMEHSVNLTLFDWMVAVWS
jgi:hypothetical protein